MYYVTVAPLYPSNVEIVRLYDNFDAAVEFGGIIVDTEDFDDAMRYYAMDAERPTSSQGESMWIPAPSRILNRHTI